MGKANGTIAPEENCHLVRNRVWVRVGVSFRDGGQFSSPAIILEPWGKILKVNPNGCGIA